jgi:alkylated DNA repair dioxygenase AlkB
MEELRQAELFGEPSSLPHGLVYKPEFITGVEERDLLTEIAPLPFREARFQEYFARRRVVHFHPSGDDVAYDRGDEDTFSSGPLPTFLDALMRRVAGWLAIDPAKFVHALISEYRPGTPIGWHRDKPAYGIVVGLSLAGWGRMRFRPLDTRAPRGETVLLELEPRSVYVMQGPIRWQWQHSMLPAGDLRYSITFRTRAEDAGGATAPSTELPFRPTRNSDPL